VSVEQWQGLPDGALVIASLAGEIAAFDALVLRYRPAVLAAVRRRCGSHALAEDVCQEAFLRAFKALKHLRQPEQFAAWLHAIARREVIRLGNGEARTAHSPLDEQILGQSAVLGETDWHTLVLHETQLEVRDALATLPEEYRLPLVLHYWHEMPLEQISRFVGKPVSTIKWRMFRARAMMRAHLVRAHAEEIRETWRKSNERGNKRTDPRAAAPRAHARNNCCAGDRSTPYRQ
jgi:RNA polymerase sigma-70 factor (ECF subfamily)